MSGLEKSKRICEKLRAEMGATLLGYLEDDDIIEIMLNPDGRLWTEGHSSGIVDRGTIDHAKGVAIIGTVAAACGTVVTKDMPVLSGELPLDGSRFQGMIPPVCVGPTFTIRKKAVKVFTLDNYVDSEIMTPDIANRLRTAILDKRNIVIAGGTGSGKTTLTNAGIDALQALCPDERLVIIEDTAEIQCKQENAVIMRSNDTVSMNDLLRSTMRMRPDRIIVGEVRGGEALTLLKSWNTGHPGGFATVHANSAVSALDRLEQLISEVSVAPMGRLIGEVVDIVLFIEKANGVRRIGQMIEVAGHDGQTYLTHQIYPKTTHKEETHNVA